MRKIFDMIISYMEENHVEPYNEETGKGLIRHALIRYGFTTKEIMVCLYYQRGRVFRKRKD